MNREGIGAAGWTGQCRAAGPWRQLRHTWGDMGRSAVSSVHIEATATQKKCQVSEAVFQVRFLQVTVHSPPFRKLMIYRHDNREARR